MGSCRRGCNVAGACDLLGIERFLIEIVRPKDDRFLGPFTGAQAISMVLLAAGIVLWARRGERVSAHVEIPWTEPDSPSIRPPASAGRSDSITYEVR